MSEYSRPRGQILVLTPILLLTVLLLFALSVEMGRLGQQRHAARGVADAAAKAGMLPVADQMVTLAAARQTQAAAHPCTPDASYGTPVASCTAMPPREIVPAWLTDEDRAVLVAPPMQTQVAQAVQMHLRRNGVDDSSVIMEVFYPFAYHADDDVVRLRLRLQSKFQILWASWLGWQGAVPLTVESQQELPQRWRP